MGCPTHLPSLLRRRRTSPSWGPAQEAGVPGERGDGCREGMDFFKSQSMRQGKQVRGWSPFPEPKEKEEAEERLQVENSMARLEEKAPSRGERSHGRAPPQPGKRSPAKPMDPGAGIWDREGGSPRVSWTQTGTQNIQQGPFGWHRALGLHPPWARPFPLLPAFPHRRTGPAESPGGWRPRSEPEARTRSEGDLKPRLCRLTPKAQP